MSSPSQRTLTDRLRDGLRRTRERLGLGEELEKPDWEALEESLILADVGLDATAAILAGVRARGGGFREALRAEIREALNVPGPAPRPRSEGAPFVRMVVGVNGVGKTTTVAKLAFLSTREGRKVLVVAADTFRAAAQEQLAVWAERSGAAIVGAEVGRDPASIVHDGLKAALTGGFDEVLVDTAGRLHTKRPLMDELSKVARVAARVVPEAPHETLLVMDATVGTNGLAQARQFAEALPLSGIALTKMDGTARGGVVLAIARELGLGVRYLGMGEGMEDLVAFETEAFVEALTS